MTAAIVTQTLLALSIVTLVGSIPAIAWGHVSRRRGVGAQQP
jgi:hypothetical protein